MKSNLDDIRYPIGQFASEPDPTPAEKADRIGQLAGLPDELRAAVDGLTDAQFDTPYREGAWTVRQITHHVADEHLNGFQYCKMALTEDAPAIRKYIEPAWAALDDARLAPPDFSLNLLAGLHARWAYLFRSLAPGDWEKVYVHPSRGRVSMLEALQLYAWHGRHHAAQIRGLRTRSGW